MKTVIKNAKILTMQDEAIDNGWLLTDGEKISSFGEMNKAVPKADTEIDAKGGWLLPGFVEAHAHIGMFGDSLGFESDDGNEMTDPVTPHLRAIDSINPLDRCFSDAISAGVTTVVTGMGSANPIGGQFAAMKTNGSCVDDMVIKAPSGVKFALGENPKTVYHNKNQTPTTRMATAATIRDALARAKKYMEKLEESRLNDEADEPEYDIRMEALIPLLTCEIPAQFHAHRADDIFTAMRIAQEYGLKYSIIHGTEGYLISEKLKEKNVSVISGPIISDRSKPELKNHTSSSAGILNANGILCAITTDHPETPIQYLPLCAALCAREGMPDIEALKAITINAAVISGISDRVGSIATGKDADVVVHNGNPLDIRTKPVVVLINGERCL